VTDADRFRRVEELFDRAVDLPADERRAVLDPVRAADPALWAEVERLLAREDRRGAELPAPGTRVGPYRLVERIGGGGMGDVYRAVRADGHYEQTVAVKLVRGGFADRTLLERFRSERQILARLAHPNIARLYDGAVTSDGLPYLAMEYVDGRPITEHCDAERMTIERRLGLYQAVCRAVQHAHRNLIVHRDLKPSNILVTSDGEVKLLDFGIAKLLAPDPGDTGVGAPRTVGPLMTPEYAAPEQVRGETITTATDVYALGLLLHELLCGSRAQSGASDAREALERVVCEQDPLPPSRACARGEAGDVAARVAARGVGRADVLQRRLRGDLDTIVANAVQKDPARRYGSAADLAADVERHLAGLPVLARPDTLGYRAGKFVRRHRFGFAAAAAVTLALVVGLGLAVGGLVRAQRAERRALDEAAATSRIADYLVELFEVNDPGASRGETVTARERLDRGAARIDEQLDTRPAVRVRLQRTMARAYESLGLYAPAGQLLERALAAERAAHGERSVDAARVEIALAGLAGKQGDYARALELAERGLSSIEALPAPPTADLIAALNRVGMTYGRLGDLDRAAAALERGIEIAERDLGPDHRELWSLSNNLAIVSWMRGEHRTAQALYERALGIAEREFGPEHPSVAHTLNNLALVLAQAGDHDAAIRTHERVLALREKLLDPDHPDVAETLNNLASILLATGEFDRARGLGERALAIRLRALGPDHDHVATTECNLGFALVGQGRPDAARPRFERCLAVFEAKLGADNASVAFPLVGLARVERDLGDDEAADARYRRAIAIRETLGEHHPDLRSVLDEYAAFLRSRDREAEAAALEARLAGRSAE